MSRIWPPPASTERSLFMHHLEPGLAAQQAQVPPLTIELNRQCGARIEYGGAAVLQLHHARCIAAAQVTACQQQRLRCGRDHQYHGGGTGQQPRQAAARCDRAPPFAISRQPWQRGQHLWPGGIRPARRPAAGARPAHGRVGLQPALQGSLLTFRQRACTAPDHPAQRLPGLTRRGFDVFMVVACRTTNGCAFLL